MNKKEIKKGRHSQEFLLGIFNAGRGCVSLQKQSCVEDPRLQTSGMTSYFMKNRAFTLIELLVVVLIVGVLAAIALPQYQKAVIKSRYAGLKLLTRAIADAEKVYYLANGSYTNNFDDLDVQTPAYTSEYTTMNSAGTAARRITRTFDWGACYLEDESVVVCTSDLAKMRFSIHFGNNLQRCWANNIEDNSIQNQICKAETGKSTYTGRSAESKYTFWNY